jgi:hypothetical protein
MVAMFSSVDLTGVNGVVSSPYHDHQGLAGEPVHGPEGFAAVVAAAGRA